MSELGPLLEALEKTGEDRAILADPAIAHLVVAGNRILSSRDVPGLDTAIETLPDGVGVQVTIAEGTILEHPIHLCFGMVHRGRQRIRMDVRLKRNASAHIIAHCLFPEPVAIQHLMSAEVAIEDGASLHYSETHFHGPHGEVEVVPKARVRVGRGGRYQADFTLTTGRVGRLDIDTGVQAQENAVVELTARIFGHQTDDIKIREQVDLIGANARGLIKTRIALEDDAKAEVIGITEGKAAGARGHVDCLELIKDRAVARAVPIVNVSHPLAKVTHEAAIGSVDQRQMETLMAHGLTPEEAVDVIVMGVLK